ncbi:LysM peptidoglycan-binding domain-containing protein [Pengzhenrongella frigida]|uniref:LysM peptidoglycan-binding domain-containing protein n=1 Tax=Pengzhenrongella frigida TaxID=1259133 RepID=A0A4Q5N1A8_9MICO|nr:LysM peptidoglycan-binding domain-containing protein [Cellulomonas sp. HLT2-17]RYV50327.1 LysM peptidoglycan-binding domain-containing protein [Cellulomonas sp. HLT2-17]
MTQHGNVRPGAPGHLDDAQPAGARPAPSTRTRRRVATGTGATLALAVASVAVGGAAHADETYVVRTGDTVSHIAARTGASVSAISRANNLANAAKIRIGQQLTIPTAGGAPAAPVAAAAPASTQAAGHTVASGETVSHLAARYGTSVAAIVTANGLDARAFIRVGQQLSIPGAAGSTATAAVAAAPAATAATYRVVSGDTVSGIAARHGTTVAALISANGLDARAFIRVGQQLSVTGGSATGAAPTAVAVSNPVAATATYRVVSGDTVSSIATRHGTTVAAITSANSLGARSLIRIGQQLTIPGASASTAAPTVKLVGSTFAGRTYPEAVVASANLNKATLLSLGVPSKAQMQAKVAATASAMGVDPALAQAIAFQESGFNHTAVSPANAIGTMQVIPTSGEWASQLVGRHLNLLDPDDNVTAGVAILRQLVRTGADLPTAIAGYYQGSSSVRRNGMFSDTRVYVANIQTHMSRFR